MRQDIQKSLGIKAYDIYGLTELSGPGVAYECSAQTGMHINEDHFIAEIIDPDTGEVLPEGTQGELVFTSITKQAFPLLRYRTRDICILRHEDCPCGRTHIKMCKPMGRSDDMLKIRGVNVFPSQVESASSVAPLAAEKAAQSVSLSINTSVAFAMGNNWIPLSSENFPSSRYSST